ncbi:uncharacterized protein B0T15DRAFT_535634, partial [Chaetomium strumarium]
MLVQAVVCLRMLLLGGSGTVSSKSSFLNSPEGSTDSFPCRVRKLRRSCSCAAMLPISPSRVKVVTAYGLNLEHIVCFGGLELQVRENLDRQFERGSGLGFFKQTVLLFRVRANTLFSACGLMLLQLSLLGQVWTSV